MTPPDTTSDTGNAAVLDGATRRGGVFCGPT